MYRMSKRNWPPTLDFKIETSNAVLILTLLNEFKMLSCFVLSITNFNCFGISKSTLQILLFRVLIDFFDTCKLYIKQFG